jgi:hypothetical protein
MHIASLTGTRDQLLGTSAANKLRPKKSWRALKIRRTCVKNHKA